MGADENKEVMRRFYMMFEGRSTIAPEDVCAEMYEDHMPHPGPKGVEGMKRVVAMFRRAFPDSKVSIPVLLAEGDRVAGTSILRGTHTGTLMGIPPTGRKVEMATLDIVRIADGKVAEIWHLEDVGKLMQQLGVMPPPADDH